MGDIFKTDGICGQVGLKTLQWFFVPKLYVTLNDSFFCEL